ncbi:MAG: hypothetical protein AAGF74_06115 [Pseudomonadota bacterium]
MEKLIPTTNDGVKMAAEDQTLQLTIAFAPYEMVMPAVVGLFRANHGYSRLIDNFFERQWFRLERMETERAAGAPPSSVDSVRVVKPQAAAQATIIEDFLGTNHDQLAALLPGVNFLHLYSEYCNKNAERHSYAWRQDGKIKRHVYFHHNYQFPGWDWEEEGHPQPWEDTERIKKKRVSARCDRAMMLEYSKRLGCELHGPLANDAWSEAILVYPIEGTDPSDLPPPTTLGEDFRKQAVSLGFGQGEEDFTFRGHIEDAWYYASVEAHYAQVGEAIRRSRTAAALLDAMKSRGTAPDWQDEYSRDFWAWQTALQSAYSKFPDAPELKLLEDLAKSETRDHRFPLNDLRLRNIKADVVGGPREDDPDMLAQIFRGTPYTL